MLGHHHHHHDNRTQQQLLSYVQDYLECVESLPLDIQRNVSLLREIDSKYQEVLKEVDEVFEKYQGEQDASQRKRLQLQLQRALIISQELGDEKIGVVTQMTELVENRSRQMDSHSLGLQEPGMAGGGGTPDRPTSTATERRSASGGGGSALLPEASSASDLQRSSARRPRRQQQQQQQQRTSESRGGGDSSLLSLAPPNGGGGGALGGGGSLADDPAGDAEADPVPAGPGSSSSSAQQQQQQPRSEKKSSSSSKSSSKKKKRKSAKQERADASASPVDFAAIDPNEPTYCLCEQVSYGEMIGCDNEQCPIEWFHFSCVGLTYKPKGKWYCPKCRGGDNEKTMDKSLGDKNRKERRSR